MEKSKQFAKVKDESAVQLSCPHGSRCDPACASGVAGRNPCRGGDGIVKRLIAAKNLTPCQEEVNMIESLPATASSAEVVDVLNRDVGVIVKSLADHQMRELLEDELAPLLAARKTR